jgi:ribosome modulation factor
MTNATLDYLKQFIADLPTRDEKLCFAMGYDCGMNGADEKNCHFSLFSSPANTKAWEAGKAQAEKDKAAK